MLLTITRIIKMIVNKETIAELAKENKRLDERSLTEFRQPILISTNISWTAEGSARVQIGETVVMAGVKLSLEKPYNDTPDEGGIMVNAELSPIASPEFESGPPSIKAVELARVVDRGIREAKAIDLKKLCLVPGEKAWFVIVDIISLNDGGNLLDVAGMAALAALKTARFPVVDPTNEEEKAYEARLTVGSDAKGTISALQKGGEVPLSIAEIGKMVDLALEKASFLRKELNKALKA